MVLNKYSFYSNLTHLRWFERKFTILIGGEKYKNQSILKMKAHIKNLKFIAPAYWYLDRKHTNVCLIFVGLSFFKSIYQKQLNQVIFACMHDYAHNMYLLELYILKRKTDIKTYFHQEVIRFFVWLKEFNGKVLN